MDKKKLFIWSLYDFANSVVMIAFFLYYSQWLVIDQGVSDFWFNMTFVFSSLLLLFTAPVAGSVADKLKAKIPGLRTATFFSFLLFSCTGIIAVFFPAFYFLSAITFTLATYFYLFSFVYYNSLLGDVADPSRHGLASGWGQFGNWLGQIVGLLAVMPFVSGSVAWFGAPGRAQALIPATVIFIIFALPLLLFFKENSARSDIKINYKDEAKGAYSSLKALLNVPGLGLFFVAYFFFNDAVITASNNFPIYMDKVFGVSDNTKSYLLLGILVASAVSAPLSGWLSDKFGLKKALLVVLGGWIIIFPLMALSTGFTFFSIISLLMGLWFGAIWTVTRAVVTRLTPPDMLNRSFTYYTLMERLATFVGPISWSVIVAVGPTAGNLNYKAALMTMALFVAIGFIPARKIDYRTAEARASN